MTASPSPLGEWLLMQIGAPDALVGDLCESARRRGQLWYWGQVAAFAAFACAGVIRRHPVRTAWGMLIACVIGFALAHAADLRRQPPSQEALRLELVSAGWRVADASDHRLHVVPMARVRVVNRLPDPVTGVQVNVVFRRVADGIEWGNHWRPVSRWTGLAPGAASELLLLTSDTGHLSAAPAETALRHPGFVDATVQVYGRYGAQAWAKLAEYRVPRQLVEP